MGIRCAGRPVQGRCEAQRREHGRRARYRHRVNKKTASLGLQANGAELAANNIGTQEHNLRFGLSAGEGFGGRLHYGDADKDGVREMGFGFDLGPASFDMRSELLGYSFNMSRDIGRYALNVFGGLFD